MIKPRKGPALLLHLLVLQLSPAPDHCEALDRLVLIIALMAIISPLLYHYHIVPSVTIDYE